MSPLLMTLDGNSALRSVLLAKLDVQGGDCDIRHFPDGETYLRVLADCRDRDVIIQCGLQRPDQVIMPLLFCAETLREFGARRIGLVAPYLAYMRQDMRFHAGEAVTSRLFARLLSTHVDWLITVDPHLHRYQNLNELYMLPHRVLTAAPLLAQWIQREVARPLLIGPDSESAQWVAAVAGPAGIPYLVLDKTRRGDRDVEIAIPVVERWREHTPVLVDDIISTGHTMLQTIGHLLHAGLRAPVCIGVHGLFAEHADSKLLSGGAARLVTTNSVPHASNTIELGDLLAAAIAEMLAAHTRVERTRDCSG